MGTQPLSVLRKRFESKVDSSGEHSLGRAAATRFVARGGQSCEVRT